MERTFEEDKPIFVAGIGPRTGTTLVQRIINSHPDAWIWGELGQAVEIKLTEAWEDMDWWRAAFEKRDKYLYKALKEGQDLSASWISALVPSENRMWQAWRAFFEVSLRRKRIWGFKSITCEHLAFMRYLFPTARIIITARSPLAQYKSYRTGINGVEKPARTVRKLWEWYQDYLETPTDHELLLLLDDFEPEKWVDEIFRYIDEPVPSNALKAAEARVRGPVPPPLEKVESEIEKMIHEELDPLYQKIVARKGAAQ